MIAQDKIVAMEIESGFTLSDTNDETIETNVFTNQFIKTMNSDRAFPAVLHERIHTFAGGAVSMWVRKDAARR